MAEEQAKEAAEETPKKGGPGMLMGVILPAVLAGAAGFGGGMMGAASAAPAETEAPVEPDNLPGPTVQLQPFVLSLVDKDNNPHAMKVTVAVELEKDAAEADFETFVPRIRDATISMLRGMRYEDASKGETQAQMRAQLLERTHELGALMAVKIWFTDFVVQ